MTVRVPPRVRLAAAVLVALGALAGMVAVVVIVRERESGTGHLPFASTTRAPAPFAAFETARVAVGDRCLHVLVARTPAQREQGLRGVRSLVPYDGMLFASPSTGRGAFTMAGTPQPLEITFFAADGAPVDRLRMEPCPDGTDATCPPYRSRAPYRYALEQPVHAGAAAASGGLGGCAT